MGRKCEHCVYTVHSMNPVATKCCYACPNGHDGFCEHRSYKCTGCDYTTHSANPAATKCCYACPNGHDGVCEHRSFGCEQSLDADVSRVQAAYPSSPPPPPPPPPPAAPSEYVEESYEPDVEESYEPASEYQALVYNQTYRGGRLTDWWDRGQTYSNCVFVEGTQFVGYMYDTKFENCTMLQCDFTGCWGGPTFTNCTVQDAMKPNRFHDWNATFLNTPPF